MLIEPVSSSGHTFGFSTFNSIIWNRVTFPAAFTESKSTMESPWQYVILFQINNNGHGNFVQISLYCSGALIVKFEQSDASWFLLKQILARELKLTQWSWILKIKKNTFKVFHAVLLK